MNPVLASVKSATLEVLNQPPALVNYNLFSTDAVLASALDREGAAWVERGWWNSVRRLAAKKRFAGDFKPMRIRRCCARTTALGIASMRSNFIRRGTS